MRRPQKGEAVHQLVSTFLITSVLLVSPVPADDASTSVDMGRQALRTQRSIPWYNPETDALRKVPIPRPAKDAGRHSSWRVGPPASSPKKKSGFRLPSLASTLLENIIWGVLAVVLAGLVVLFVFAFLRSEQRRKPATEENEKEEIPEKNRLDQLPVPIHESDRNLLETARMYRKAGDYDQAITYLFAHMLVELDRNHLIRLTRGKTNRQYLDELIARLQTGAAPVENKLIAGMPRPSGELHRSTISIAPAELDLPLVSIVRETMIAFEDVFFGHHHISEQRFQHCWERLDLFEEQLNQTVLPV